MNISIVLRYLFYWEGAFTSRKRASFKGKQHDIEDIIHNLISRAYISVGMECTSVTDAIIAFLVCNLRPWNLLTDKLNPIRKREAFIYEMLDASVTCPIID